MMPNATSRVRHLYLNFFQKYGQPKGFWEKWCKKRKTKEDKEEIVLGAVLTQRTNWQNVELALKNLKKEKLLSIEKIYQIGKKNKNKLESLIRPAGFYRQKARRIFELSKFIVENYGSLEKFFGQGLKTCREELLKIYGIGPETADSILLYAGGLPIFVIDEYTRRFVKKYGLSEKFSYDELQNLFQQSLPKDPKLYQDFHAIIVLEEKGLI
jgi:endonuclease-3 related protein